MVEKEASVAVITVSTRSSAGQRDDRSGPLACRLVEERLGKVVHYAVVPDSVEAIRSELVKSCDELHADVVFTLGGTGLAPMDLTPEATLSVIERPVPGIAETLRAKSLEKTATAMLSRAVAGVRGRSLVINMPGSERAVEESLAIVLPALKHAVELIHGRVKDCGRK
jgi:molybdenum cofactor synthesis domain-containing protein